MKDLDYIHNLLEKQKFIKIAIISSKEDKTNNSLKYKQYYTITDQILEHVDKIQSVRIVKLSDFEYSRKTIDDYWRSENKKLIKETECYRFYISGDQVYGLLVE